MRGISASCCPPPERTAMRRRTLITLSAATGAVGLGVKRVAAVFHHRFGHIVRRTL
jgi:hypothetical protein